MAEDRSEQFAARSRRGQAVEDDPDETYYDDAAAESDSEDLGFPLDDVATMEADQPDSGTADVPVDPEEVS
jgi:hypothetical protein